MNTASLPDWISAIGNILTVLLTGTAAYFAWKGVGIAKRGLTIWKREHTASRDGALLIRLVIVLEKMKRLMESLITRAQNVDAMVTEFFVDEIGPLHPTVDHHFNGNQSDQVIFIRIREEAYDLFLELDAIWELKVSERGREFSFAVESALGSLNSCLIELRGIAYDPLKADKERLQGLVVFVNHSKDNLRDRISDLNALEQRSRNRLKEIYGEV